MPLHDWTRVDAGIFHAFHSAWVTELGRALNGGVLPEDFYALGEQVGGGNYPDVVTSCMPRGIHGTLAAIAPDSSDAAVLTATPRTHVVAHDALGFYAAAQKRLAIRHAGDHQVVALIEIVSKGNKAGSYPWRVFLDGALCALRKGVHLLLLDPHPPTPRDPQGVHGAVWGALTGSDYRQPSDADRTLAAYSAGPVKSAYVEPTAVGVALRDMPLFLTPDAVGHVEVPLEATYRAAFATLPRRHRDILDGAG